MLQSLFEYVVWVLPPANHFSINSRAQERGQLRLPFLRSGTYVVCLDCGKEFAYDWKDMRVGQPYLTALPCAPQLSLSLPVSNSLMGVR